MQETKLTIRLPRSLLDNVKKYARKHNTTLTSLISEYLRRVPAEEELLDQAPTVRRLSGTLSAGLSSEDYKKHLEEKYGRSD
jgi:hypothetical protein